MCACVCLFMGVLVGQRSRAKLEDRPVYAPGLTTMLVGKLVAWADLIQVQEDAPRLCGSGLQPPSRLAHQRTQCPARPAEGAHCCSRVLRLHLDTADVDVLVKWTIRRVHKRHPVSCFSNVKPAYVLDVRQALLGCDPQQGGQRTVTHMGHSGAHGFESSELGGARLHGRLGVAAASAWSNCHCLSPSLYIYICMYICIYMRVVYTCNIAPTDSDLRFVDRT